MRGLFIVSIISLILFFEVASCSWIGNPVLKNAIGKIVQQQTHKNLMTEFNPITNTFMQDITEAVQSLTENPSLPKVQALKRDRKSTRAPNMAKRNRERNEQRTS